MGILCDTSAKQKLENAGVSINITSTGGDGSRKKDFIDGRPYPAKPNASAFKLWAGNLKRAGGSFFNDPGSGAGDTCFLMFSTERGPEVSTTFWSVKLNPGDYFELPPMRDGQPHHGEVWCIFTSVVANNLLQTTEYVYTTVEENT